MTLTSRIGSFFFPKGTALVDAKAIRDTVMGVWFASRQDSKKKSVRSVEECKKMMASVNWENRASKIPFQLTLNPK